MNRAGTVLKLFEGKEAASGPLAPPESPARQARHELLADWMSTHTRVLGLWLDRLVEEGDDADLISMIHRQHAWLCMMQARAERS